MIPEWLGIVVPVAYIAMTVWTARDAEERDASATRWGVVVFVTGVFGLLAYLLLHWRGD